MKTEGVEKQKRTLFISDVTRFGSFTVVAVLYLYLADTPSDLVDNGVRRLICI